MYAMYILCSNLSGGTVYIRGYTEKEGNKNEENYHIHRYSLYGRNHACRML